MTADSTLHARERISLAYSEEDELRWTQWPFFFSSSSSTVFFFFWKACDEISLERTSSDRNECNPLSATEMTQGCFFSGMQATGDEHIAFWWLDSLSLSEGTVWISPLASNLVQPHHYQHHHKHCREILSLMLLHHKLWKVLRYLGGKADEMLKNKMDCPINELNWLIELHVIKAAKWISFPSHFSLWVFCLGNTTKYNLPVLERGWRFLAYRFVHEKNIVLASVSGATRQ